MMNSQGWIRGMMSKSYETEQFLTHVVTTIERQLKLWDEHYEVRLLQDLMNDGMYFIVVYSNKNEYKVSINEADTALLQDVSPFSLDRHIWRSLVKEGLVMGESDGNYLTYCAV